MKFHRNCKNLNYVLISKDLIRTKNKNFGCDKAPNSEVVKSKFNSISEFEIQRSNGKTSHIFIIIMYSNFGNCSFNYFNESHFYFPGWLNFFKNIIGKKNLKQSLPWEYYLLIRHYKSCFELFSYNTYTQETIFIFRSLWSIRYLYFQIFDRSFKIIISRDKINMCLKPATDDSQEVVTRESCEKKGPRTR